MIVLKHITKTFDGFKAVDNISFTVEKEETVVFLGMSGCGKTTLLKMINRLITRMPAKYSSMIKKSTTGSRRSFVVR